MLHLRYSLLVATALCLGGMSAMAQSHGNLTDPQIALAGLYVGLQLDQKVNRLLMNKHMTKKGIDSPVALLAYNMRKDAQSIAEQGLHWLDKQKFGPHEAESDIFKSLAEEETETWMELSELKGADLDRAYLRHEVEYHQSLKDIYEKELIPNVQDGELKSLLQATLKVLQEHQERAQYLLIKLE
jgi:putative membrane protein